MTTLTGMLDRMETNGLVRRERGDADRRKILINLTENAKMLKDDYDEVTKEISEIYYKGFAEEETRQFEAYLRRILVNVEERM